MIWLENNLAEQGNHIFFKILPKIFNAMLNHKWKNVYNTNIMIIKD